MAVIQSLASDVYVVDCTPHGSYINFAIYFNGQFIDFSQYGWLVTYYSTTIASNKQAVPSLGNRIYVYSFGILPIATFVGGIILPNIQYVLEDDQGKQRQMQHFFDPFALADILSGIMMHETTEPLIIFIGNKNTDLGNAYWQRCFLHKIRIDYKNPTTRIGGFMLGFIAGKQE